nr:immunoglobulin light chain junction region [Macaca mulatta]MOX41733.1 immunoglobulin light chain junction region [Macaca mulatta]MOX42027.1 immunoglobulin light chain junction region [Macaca mulatta]MOX42038.1 immunoglobulin light chain junction region [Macaca mulatta]MOX42200.1 immunoglobulin light chain junction region [Macaca mulatta]
DYYCQSADSNDNHVLF